MKYAKLLLFVLVFALFAPVAFSQDAMIVVDSKEFGKHERPLVEFNHETHAAKIDCLKCHHDYDAYNNNRGGEGQPCSTCHAMSEKQGTPALREAFHLQCKGCHRNMLEQNKKSGPLTCGECHIRK